MVGDQLVSVSTSAFRNKANEATQHINCAKRYFERIDQILTGTNSYWRGEASDAFMRLYAKDRTQVREMFTRLSKQPSEILNIANVYDEAECDNNKITGSLDGRIS